ncbi:MAG: gliding motility lipoprotein GldJ [Bacteroidota bacterium]|nr:gliding motility lipoprotein GldJ [Bacteroidota bacterium]
MKTNKILIFNLLLLAGVSVGLTSCSKGGGRSGGISKATGWRMDGQEGRFYYNSKFREQQTPIGMVAIEGGTFTMGRVQDDPMHDWNNSPNQQHVQSFFMDETEVTNVMYAEYLYYIKKVFPPTEENYKNIYNGALPDTLVWRDRLGYNESMVTDYLWHPAYGEYPVVGVNWIQANEFCKWRTDFTQMNILEQNRMLSKDAKSKELNAGNYFSRDAYVISPSTVFGGDENIVLKAPHRRQDSSNVYASMSSGLIISEFRLPTEAEWEYAAMALNENREFNLYRGKKKYPWSGQYTRSGKRKTKGDQLANFKQGVGDYGGPAGWSTDNADITAPVASYPPNAFGLYDMAGNVNEWVLDVYRPIVDYEMNDFNYYRGNVYMKNEISEDGKVLFVTPEDIRYDTLPNGKVVAVSLPGQVSRVPIDENDTYLRYNFDKSDTRDYRDGDSQSMKDFYANTSEEDEGEGAKRMYNSPRHNVSVDSVGSMNRQWDASNKRTTLVDNNSRVYKGGSWRDRAYWLDPAQRRYYPQFMATDDIGFRCAMSRAGSKSTKKRARG